MKIFIKAIILVVRMHLIWYIFSLLRNTLRFDIYIDFVTKMLKSCWNRIFMTFDFDGVTSLKCGGSLTQVQWKGLTLDWWPSSSQLQIRHPQYSLLFTCMNCWRHHIGVLQTLHTRVLISRLDSFLKKNIIQGVLFKKINFQKGVGYYYFLPFHFCLFWKPLI